MAKTIKLAEGFKVTVDGYVKEFRHDGQKTVRLQHAEIC